MEVIVHIWHWILNFTGVNNGENGFATHMYNFWSGFGGGLIQFSLLGAIVALYRHYVLQNKVVKAVERHLPINIIEEKIQNKPKAKSKRK